LAGCRGVAPLGLRPIHPGIFSARRRAGRVRGGAVMRGAPRLGQVRSSGSTPSGMFW